MTLGELFEETYIQGEIAIRSYDSTGTTIEHYLGDAEEFYPETLYGGDGRDWLIVGIAGAWSYDVYGLHVAHDGKKEKKPLRAEWLVHELTDAGEEV